ncbi:hypothetical protein M9H77_33212 [Catharanthus roseus]|uniref:Uncharacterized protein n=1 Tax=Catharanthus roseus TaxID=4058 RepID=A0ACB9ZLV7_CATRO|nr:hypothetical protein M9H77_33212 [Catharanthus roseus]
MSRSQDPHRAFFPFGNPFKMMFPKGSYPSARLLELLTSFEEKLAERLRQLRPRDKQEVLSLSWMRCAMETLSAIHTDIKAFITALELPVCDWDEKWVDVYLDNSVKLLDICIAFSSELSRLNQGHLFLQCVLHNLESSSSKQFLRAQSSLDGWRQHISSKNPRLDNCFNIMDNLVETLNLPKIRNSAKGKILMQAMYGVRLVTVFICNVFAAAFSGSAKRLLDLHPLETCLWSSAFVELQSFINVEIRNIYSSGKATVLKELEAVEVSVKKIYPIVQEGENTERLENLTTDLGKNADNLSNGLDVLAKEVDGFFQIVLTGRDALLGNLRGGTEIPSPRTPRNNNNNEGHLVR